jgi:hypothetical protein
MRRSFLMPQETRRMDKLKELMRRCKCSVSVTVNAHRDYYETAEVSLSDMSSRRVEAPEIDPTVRAKMIETDTIIEVQFYPNTPVGFYVVYHYDLDAALDEALACFGEPDAGAPP